MAARVGARLLGRRRTGPGGATARRSARAGRGVLSHGRCRQERVARPLAATRHAHSGGFGWQPHRRRHGEDAGGPMAGRLVAALRNPRGDRDQGLWPGRGGAPSALVRGRSCVFGPRPSRIRARGRRPGIRGGRRRRWLSAPPTLARAGRAPGRGGGSAGRTPASERAVPGVACGGAASDAHPAHSANVAAARTSGGVAKEACQGGPRGANPRRTDRNGRMERPVRGTRRATRGRCPGCLFDCPARSVPVGTRRAAPARRHRACSLCGPSCLHSPRCFGARRATRGSNLGLHRKGCRETGSLS